MSKFEKHEERSGNYTVSSHYNKAVDRIEELEKAGNIFTRKVEIFLNNRGIESATWASFRDFKKALEE